MKPLSEYYSKTEVEQRASLPSLLDRVQTQERKLSKEGVSLIIDLGWLLSNGGFERLSEYEKYISEVSANTGYKQICVCHQQDFEAHLTTRQANFLDHHTKSVIMMGSNKKGMTEIS